MHTILLQIALGKMLSPQLSRTPKNSNFNCNSLKLDILKPVAKVDAFADGPSGGRVWHRSFRSSQRCTGSHVRRRHYRSSGGQVVLVGQLIPLDSQDYY